MAETSNITMAMTPNMGEYGTMTDFIIDQWDTLDEIGDWIAGDSSTTVSLDTDGRYEGAARLKVEGASGNATLRKNGTFNWEGYDGLLMDIYSPKGYHGTRSLILYNGTDFSDIGIGIGDDSNDWDGPVYVPIPMKTNGGAILDRSNITGKILIRFTPGASGDALFYIDNIRLVRTTPYRAAILRFDDGTAVHWNIAVPHLDEFGFKGNFGIILSNIGSAGYLTLDQCKKMDANGHVIINHTYDHPDFENDVLSKAEVYQEYALVARWLEGNGFFRGRKCFINPYSSTSSDIQNVLKQDGAVSVQYGIMPTYHSVSMPTDFTIPSELQDFVDYYQSGIIQITAHDITDEAGFVTFLQWIQSNFTEVITFPEVMERMPEQYQHKYDSIGLFDLGYKKTLADNMLLEFFHGGSLILDPGGANRNINPIKEFRPFHRVEVINTADAAETLTFEPTFTASGTHDGADNASVLTDSGESWVVDQLVGKTINNTTDGSSGVITANTATTITATLSGGTDNDWDIGDAYTITPAGLNQAIAQNERGIFVYDGDGGWIKVYVGS